MVKKIIHKILQKKTVFIMIFLSVFFMIPIFSVDAKGETINPMYNHLLNDDLFSSNSFQNTVVKNDYLDLYNELLNYYNSNLSTAYDSYVVRAQISNCLSEHITDWSLNKPVLFYFNSKDVNSDFLLRNSNTTIHSFGLNLMFKNIYNVFSLYFDANNNIKVNSNSLSSGRIELVSSYCHVSRSEDYRFYFETNLDRPVIWDGGVHGGANTILFKKELYNKGDVMYQSLVSQGNTYLFDLDGDIFQNGHYIGLTFYFKKPADGKLNFKIELIENEEDKPSLDFVPAFDLSFGNLAETLEKIKNCEYSGDGFGGCFTTGADGGGGGGGGGGRFGDDDDYCEITNFPMPEVKTNMYSEYGLFHILTCENHRQKSADYFKTTQIKITTNAQVFLTHRELEKDYLNNPPNYFDWSDNADNSIKNPSDLFKIINQYMSDNRLMINEISNLSNNIFNGLNSEIRTFIIASYSLLIVVAIAFLIRR